MKWIHSDLKKWSDVIHFEIQACFCMILVVIWASLVAQMVKNLPAMRETWVRFLGWEDPLEEGMATLVFLPGESPWTEESGGLQSVRSQRVRHD